MRIAYILEKYGKGNIGVTFIEKRTRLLKRVIEEATEFSLADLDEILDLLPPPDWGDFFHPAKIGIERGAQREIFEIVDDHFSGLKAPQPIALIFAP